MSKINEVRTGKAIGEVKAVLLYRVRSLSERMMAVRIPNELASGCFLFDGKNVHFHESDEKFKKFIVGLQTVPCQAA